MSHFFHDNNDSADAKAIPIPRIFPQKKSQAKNSGQHFLLFPQCFQNKYFLMLLKVGIMWEEYVMQLT